MALGISDVEPMCNRLKMSMYAECYSLEEWTTKARLSNSRLCGGSGSYLLCPRYISSYVGIVQIVGAHPDDSKTSFCMLMADKYKKRYSTMRVQASSPALMTVIAGTVDVTV